MSDFYVNKSGSDSNGGTSAADAWLTIQHAVDNVSDGDTIIVQSGVYEENIATDKQVTIEADGYCVMDGSAISGTAFSAQSADGRIFVNGFYILDYDRCVAIADYADIVQLKNCYVNCPAYYDPYESGYSPLLLAKNTIFDNCMAEFRRFCKYRPVRFEHCTFLGSTAIETTAYNNDEDISITSCYIEGDIILKSEFNIINLDYNNVQGSITYKGTTYATLSDFQNAYPTLAPHSINENGDFNNDYTLRWSSPNIGAGKNGTNIGARGPASYFESTDEIFEGANLTNVSRNANGDFELDGGATTGTVVSAVLDFGSDITLGNLRMKANEDYPADVIDSDIDDSEPNRANYEYRSATEAEGSFLQGDATPSWNEAERGDDLGLTCRYFQVRITLRSNGVEA